jgi:hypothetical protein
MENALCELQNINVKTCGHFANCPSNLHNGKIDALALIDPNHPFPEKAGKRYKPFIIHHKGECFMKQIFAIGKLMLAGLFALFMVVTLGNTISWTADETKDIHILPMPKTEGAPSLDVKFTTQKSVYQVNEPIQFDVKLSKSAYVYLFSTRSDNATLIYPNKLDKAQKIAANKTTSLPVRSQFVSDRPGTERLVLLASTEPINLQTTKGLTGDFDNIALNEVDDILKNVRVESVGKAEKQVTEMDVVIQGKPRSQAPRIEEGPDKAQPAVLVSTNKPLYGLNESMTIAFASDQDGYITLYAINPLKEAFPLKEAKVEKDKIYRIKATTEAPAGQHILVGVYSKTRPQHPDKVSSKSVAMALKMINPNTQDEMLKNIRVEDESQIYAVHPFTIQD